MNAAMTELRKRVARSTQTAIAKEAKVSAQFVNDALHGRREITGKLLHWLGYERVVTYRKIKP